MSRFTGLRLSGRDFACVFSTLVWLVGCTQDTPEADIEKLVAEMTQRVATTSEAEVRDGLIPRYNQPKTIACVDARFQVHDDLPESLRAGLFKEPASYPAYLRFASASQWDDSKKDIRGLSIRVSEVQGETMWGEQDQQDFLLNSYPALFVATPEAFLQFMRARQEGGILSMVWFFLNPFDHHLGSLRTVLAARKHHMSPLDIRYWSTVPFAHAGSSAAAEPPAVKYAVMPCSGYRTEVVVEPGENQLRGALREHLEQAPGCFEFGVQTQFDPESMPIEDASVIWSEEESPFQTVATITFELQPFDTPEALASCERSTFNPWQSLAAHAPLGRMNAVRGEVYARGADFRNRR